MRRKWVLFGGLFTAACVAPVDIRPLAPYPGAWFATARPAIDEVQRDEVHPGGLQQQVLAVDSFRARDWLVVRVRASSRVHRLHVAVGQAVKRGDLIAELDALPQQTALYGEDTAAASGQACLTARAATLLPIHRASRALAAGAGHAGTQSAAARNNQGCGRIVAPLDGVIVAVTARHGQAPGTVDATLTIVIVGEVRTALRPFPRAQAVAGRLSNET